MGREPDGASAEYSLDQPWTPGVPREQALHTRRDRRGVDGERLAEKDGEKERGREGNTEGGSECQACTAWRRKPPTRPQFGQVPQGQGDRT